MSLVRNLLPNLCSNIIQIQNLNNVILPVGNFSLIFFLSWVATWMIFTSSIFCFVRALLFLAVTISRKISLPRPKTNKLCDSIFDLRERVWTFLNFMTSVWRRIWNRTLKLLVYLATFSNKISFQQTRKIKIVTWQQDRMHLLIQKTICCVLWVVQKSIEFNWELAVSTYLTKLLKNDISESF